MRALGVRAVRRRRPHRREQRREVGGFVVDHVVQAQPARRTGRSGLMQLAIRSRGGLSSARAHPGQAVRASDPAPITNGASGAGGGPEPAAAAPDTTAAR